MVQNVFECPDSYILICWDLIFAVWVNVFFTHILAVSTMWCINGETKNSWGLWEFAVQFLKPELNLKCWQQERKKKQWAILLLLLLAQRKKMISSRKDADSSALTGNQEKIPKTLSPFRVNWWDTQKIFCSFVLSRSSCREIISHHQRKKRRTWVMSV